MTKMLVSVRIAGLGDAEAISNLLFEFNGEGLSPDELAGRMAEVEGLETVFVGEWHGSPAGLLVLRTAPTVSGPEDWAEITELYVRPGARRPAAGRGAGAGRSGAGSRPDPELHGRAPAG